MRSHAVTTVIVLVLLSVPAFATSLPQDRAAHVLLLHSYDSSAAPYDRVAKNFMEELQRRSPGRVAFSEMDLDARWGDAESRERPIATLLRNHIQAKPVDIVVALGPSAVRFWLDERDSIAGDLPVICLARESLFDPAEFREQDVAVWTEWSFTAVMENILTIRPSISKLVFVFGSSPQEATLAEEARTELADYGRRIGFEFTNDLALPEIEARLGRLGEDAAVFYGIFNVDAAGTIMRATSGLDAVRNASGAPVFGAFDNQVGEGIVGGRLIQVSQISSSMATAAGAILRGEPFRERWQVVKLSEPRYDWQELEAWGIDRSLLPAGSIVLFRPDSLWDQYRFWIIGIATIIAAQGFLIVSLLHQRRRRHRAELARARVSGQLITAHEDERRRIARELHDDLSQRIARLSIDAAGAKGLVGDSAADESIDKLRDELGQVGRDVHDMSYRLHPAVLEDLGLETALRIECQRVRDETGWDVVERVDEAPAEVPVNAALCVYRIAQEALNNAVKYANARRIIVTLRFGEGELSMTVHDDGRGFRYDPLAVRSGLGLSSMNERVKLVGGTLDIRTSPGAGTSIAATVPLVSEKTS